MLQYDQFQGNMDGSIYMKTCVINILECQVFHMIYNLNSSSHFNVIVLFVLDHQCLAHIFQRPCLCILKKNETLLNKTTLTSLLNPCLGRDFNGFYGCGGYI